MKAAVCDKYGSPDGVQIREVERPAQGDGEVRVRVHATTVTYGDAALRRLSLPFRLALRLLGGMGKSRILGHELAGEIESTGKDVAGFKPGDQVFACTGHRAGAHAEYVCLPQDGAMAIKPANLSFEEAAAVPIGANTALLLLRKGDIQAGQKVLVYGASGSVGTYAVQLARAFGAEVTGVCSTANLELVRSLGAARVIDYTEQDFTRSGATYDVIFDTVRKLSSSRCTGSLKRGGLFLSTRSPTTQKPENLVFLRELIEAGKLRPVIDRRYPLDQIAEAHRYVDKGHKTGNVVITVVQAPGA